MVTIIFPRTLITSSLLLQQQKLDGLVMKDVVIHIKMLCVEIVLIAFLRL